MKYIQLFEAFVAEKQFKGLNDIPKDVKLTDITDDQKLKIVQATGNMIDFEVPDHLKGKRNFYQVVSKGKITKKKNLEGKTVYFLPGRFMDSPAYSSIEEFLANVLWDSMENKRRFNESVSKN